MAHPAGAAVANAEILSRAQALRAEGRSLRAIADAEGVATTTIQRLLRRAIA